jgi:hypothetical protein
MGCRFLHAKTFPPRNASLIPRGQNSFRPFPLALVIRSIEIRLSPARSMRFAATCCQPSCADETPLLGPLEGPPAVRVVGAIEPRSLGLCAEASFVPREPMRLLRIHFTGSIRN